MVREKHVQVFWWVLVVSVVSFFIYENQFAIADTQIPPSIKNKIGMWSDNQVSDSDFLASLDELKKLGLIRDYGIPTIQNTYDLPRYGETIFVKIIGKTDDYEQTSPVNLVVVAPDGKKSEYTIPVLESSAYSTVIPITHNSPSGTYTVHAYHLGKEFSTSYFFVRESPQIPPWIKTLQGGSVKEKFLIMTLFYRCSI